MENLVEVQPLTKSELKISFNDRFKKVLEINPNYHEDMEVLPESIKKGLDAIPVQIIERYLYSELVRKFDTDNLSILVLNYIFEKHPEVIANNVLHLNFSRRGMTKKAKAQFDRILSNSIHLCNDKVMEDIQFAIKNERLAKEDRERFGLIHKEWLSKTN